MTGLIDPQLNAELLREIAEIIKKYDLNDEETLFIMRQLLDIAETAHDMRKSKIKQRVWREAEDLE